jgi:exosortase A
MPVTAENPPVAGPDARSGGDPAGAVLWRHFRPAALPLLAGLLLLGLLFHAEAEAAVAVWFNSTAYSHCFFVIPIALYLAADRRAGLPAVPVRAWPLAALAAIPLAIAWMAAERLGIMEGRQIVAMALLELLFMSVLGWRMFRALAAPLLYLFFLVPFGAFITPALQNFTAGFIDIGLTLLRIPHLSDSVFITIPEGRFFVAEACAGLRFLIASVAFGVLYACLMYRSLGRRLGFVAASVVVPIIANGFRALGIVVIGHIIGSAQAAVTDHILYGWIFFSIVILLLILAGLPFRQDLATPRAAPIGPEPAPRFGAAGWLAAGLLIVLAAAGPAFSAVLDAGAGGAVPVPVPQFAAGAGCVAQPGGTASPGLFVEDFACPAGRLRVTLRRLPARANPGGVLAARRELSGDGGDGGDDAEISTLDVPGVEPHSWHLVLSSDPAQAIASAMWVDGAPAPGGLRLRLAMARDSLFGAAHAPVIMALGMFGAQKQLTLAQAQNARATMIGFLQAQTGLAAMIDRISAPPR